MTLEVVCEANLGMILEVTPESNLEAKAEAMAEAMSEARAEAMAEAIAEMTPGTVTMIPEMTQGTATTIPDTPPRTDPVPHRLDRVTPKGRQVRRVESILWLFLFGQHLRQRMHLQSPHQMEDYRQHLGGDTMMCGIMIHGTEHEYRL
jgi:phage tail protein X